MNNNANPNVATTTTGACQRNAAKATSAPSTEINAIRNGLRAWGVSLGNSDVTTDGRNICSPGATGWRCRCRYPNREPHPVQ